MTDRRLQPSAISHQPLAWGLYAITDRHQARGRPLEEVVAAAISGGARAFQLREKDLAAREQCELVERLVRITRPAGAKLLINDRVDIALALDLDGVHLARHSLPADEARKLLGPGRLIGASCHSVAEVREAAENGADFVVLGPIFETSSKTAFGHPLGPGVLREARRAVRLPLFALGGIKPGNIDAVMAAGADGVAAISAVMAAEDVAAAVRSLLREIRGREGM